MLDFAKLNDGEINGYLEYFQIGENILKQWT